MHAATRVALQGAALAACTAVGPAVLSVVHGSVAHLIFVRRNGDNNNNDNNLNLCKEALAQRVLSCTTDMYSGRGLDRSACAASVVFEDPVALCSGVGEVAEAFRALKAVDPECRKPPMFVNLLRTTTPDNGDDPNMRKLRLKLSQSYGGGRLDVDSDLLITVRKSDGMITRFEERWNGTPLLGMGSPLEPMFSFSRRILGRISYAVTTHIIP